MVVPKEGFIPFKGYKTYYKAYGGINSTKSPLLVLHGGPGSCHNYLLGLAELADDDRQVIFYDQLGGGLSDHSDDESLWTIQLFLDELIAVREHLGLKKVHILGHSWGGMLAIDYLLAHPKGICSAVLASSMISMPLFQAEAEKLKQAFDPKVYRTLRVHETAGTTDSDEYQSAYDTYRKNHLFRSKHFPNELETPKGFQNDIAYKKMWGASEAWANGTMQNWDRTDRLNEIDVPTLITSGQYDELTPHQAAITRDAIPNSQLEIFTNGSHLVHIEQSAEYITCISAFLAQHDCI